MKVHLIDAYGNYIKTIIQEKRFYEGTFIEGELVYKYCFVVGQLFAIAQVYA